MPRSMLPHTGPSPEASPVRNRLLAALAPEDLARLRPHLEPAALRLGDTLAEPGQPLGCVLFPEAGITSVLVVSADGRRKTEVGLIGREGLAGLPVVLGADASPYEYLVQADVRAWRLPSGALRRAVSESPGLNGVLLRYAQAFATQASYTALANASHRLDERLARWLLMCRDRLDGDELPLTQPFLSRMLAANRPGVTLAVRALVRAGLIGHGRGRITVLDRAGLEAAAGGSYGAPEAEYASLLGPPPG